MLHIEETIIVEGKYDKERLKEITDAPIICTGGFSIYKNKQLINFLKFLLGLFPKNLLRKLQYLR